MLGEKCHTMQKCNTIQLSYSFADGQSWLILPFSSGTRDTRAPIDKQSPHDTAWWENTLTGNSGSHCGRTAPYLFWVHCTHPSDDTTEWPRASVHTRALMFIERSRDCAGQ